jgi:hypothetical protein
VAGFDDHVIVKGGGNTPNFSNGNFLHRLVSLLAAQMSEARGCLKFGIRNDFR